ncbi:MAG: amidase [Alphaproteobacteria bacterium]
MSDELWRKDAGELARLISRGEVSSREVVQAHLDRVDRVNPHLNAIVRRLDETALAAADEADRAVRAGRPLGPLHGVPCTVKENIDLAGTPTTNAVAALAEATARRDAPVVERMRAAGAIPIGRTNLPDMGLRVHTHSTLHGLTRNPWNPAVTAGGSSGGEASALASGMSPIGLGNDIGGSLRNPAHCCGIASIKPSSGVVPWATDVPPTSRALASQMMLVEGVMARRVADVRLGFDVVRGAHPRDPFSVNAVLGDVEPGRALRVALMTDVPGGRTDAGIARVVAAAGDCLASLGHRVEQATPPEFEAVVDMWGALLDADLSAMQPLLDAILGPDALTFLALGRQTFAPADAGDAIALHTRRHEIAARWSAWFAELDVLVGPTWALPAFGHGFDVAGAEQVGEVFERIRPVLPANLFGAPATIVPAGLADGLPVGVQVSAWRFSDLACLSVAQAIDDRIGLATPIEPLISAT